MYVPETIAIFQNIESVIGLSVVLTARILLLSITSNPLNDGRGADGEVRAVLSSQRSTPGVKFAGRSYTSERVGTRRYHKDSGNIQTTYNWKSSRDLASQEWRVSSKYRHSGGARWGPPGR